MKKIILLSYLLWPCFLLAQNDFTVGFSLIAEYSRNRFDTQGMNDFVQSFNGFWGSKLQRPYENFSGWEFSHPNFGMGFRVKSGEKLGYVASTAFLWGRKKYQHDMLWQNGVRNELNFKIRDLQWTFSNGLHIRNLIFLEGYLDANFRRVFMKHYTIYPDGSKSLSSEYKLNGLYTGDVASLDVGVQGGLRFGPILAYVKASWALNDFPPAKGLVALSDYDSNNFPPTDFPADYVIYGTDPIRFVEEDLGVKTDDFEDFRLAIGVEWIFGLK